MEKHRSIIPFANLEVIQESGEFTEGIEGPVDFLQLRLLAPERLVADQVDVPGMIPALERGEVAPEATIVCEMDGPLGALACDELLGNRPG